MTSDKQRKAAIRRRMAETGEPYNVAARALAAAADPSIPPKAVIKARLDEAGCSWWVEISDARYWDRDNEGQYGYRPHPLHSDHDPLTAQRLDWALAHLGWERHVAEWPELLGADVTVPLRRNTQGFNQDQANRASEPFECWTCEDGEQECGCYGEDPDCTGCGGSGYRIPEHCCVCGGEPYCNCCRTCGAQCMGDCRCPAQVRTEDGRVLNF